MRTLLLRDCKSLEALPEQLIACEVLSNVDCGNCENLEALPWEPERLAQKASGLKWVATGQNRPSAFRFTELTNEMLAAEPPAQRHRAVA